MATAFYFVQSVLVLAIAAWMLNLRHYDLNVPLQFQGDTLHHVANLKAIVQDGWWWHIERLSAPFSLSMLAFPVGPNLHYGVMKLMSLAFDTPGMILNVFWLLTFALAAAAATWAMIRLGISKAAAFVFGVVFAFIPFAFKEGLGHIMILTYIAPIVCAFACVMTNGRMADLKRWEKVFLFIGAFVAGLNYIYIAFFSGFVLSVALLVCLLNPARRKMARAGALAVGLVCAGTLVNLAPTLYEWHRDAATAETLLGAGYRPSAEADKWAPMLRDFVVPPNDHPCPVMRSFRKATLHAFSAEPDDWSWLGSLGALGFVTLLATGISVLGNPGRERTYLVHVLAPMAALTVALLLLMTYGGLGSLFNAFVAPVVRAYNRATPFIAFLALATLAALITRIGMIPKRAWRMFSYALLAAVVVLGIFDQKSGAQSLVKGQEPTMSNYYEGARFVADIEKLLPEGARVFQLPFMNYPYDFHNRYKMPFWEHLKAYVWSNRLTFNWPALSRDATVWNELMLFNARQTLVDKLVLAGFDGIWFDMFGFKDAEAVLNTYAGLAASKPVLSQTGRYAFIDLALAKQRLRMRLGDKVFKQQAATIVKIPDDAQLTSAAPQEGPWSARETVPIWRQEMGLVGNKLVHLVNLTAVDKDGETRLRLQGTSGDFQMVFPDVTFGAEDGDVLHVHVSGARMVEIYWAREDDISPTVWPFSMERRQRLSTQLADDHYLLKLGGLDNYNGTIRRLRINLYPAEGADSFVLQSVDLCRSTN